MEELTKQLVSVLQSDSSLQTLLGGTASDKKIHPRYNNAVEEYDAIYYSVVDSFENTVPQETQESIYQLEIWTKSKSNLEAITTRVKDLLRYYTNSTPRIFWSVKVNEVDLDQETDRQVFFKVLRLRIWSKTN